jgi:hypothetical protein
VVAGALEKVPGMISHLPDLKIAFEIFVRFLELVSGKGQDSSRLPYGVILGFMSMEAMPAVKMPHSANDCVMPGPSLDGSCVMTRIIRTGALPAVHRWTPHTCIRAVFPALGICTL